MSIRTPRPMDKIGGRPAKPVFLREVRNVGSSAVWWLVCCSYVWDGVSRVGRALRPIVGAGETNTRSALKESGSSRHVVRNFLGWTSALAIVWVLIGYLSLRTTGVETVAMGAHGHHLALAPIADGCSSNSLLGINSGTIQAIWKALGVALLLSVFVGMVSFVVVKNVTVVAVIVVVVFFITVVSAVSDATNSMKPCPSTSTTSPPSVVS